MAQQLDKVSIIPQDEPRALAVVTPMEMLNRAVESGASLEMVEKLMTLIPTDWAIGATSLVALA